MKAPCTSEIILSVKALMAGKPEGVFTVDRDSVSRTLIILDYVMYIILNVKHYTIYKAEMTDLTYIIAITSIDP